MCKAKIPELITEISGDKPQGVAVEILAERAGINPIKLGMSHSSGIFVIVFFISKLLL
jgi:hypothetical protein